MKTLAEILAQEPVYLHNWSEKFDVVASFEEIYMSKAEYVGEAPSRYRNLEYFQEKKAKMNRALCDYANVNILFATYNTENWSGHAFVLFERDGSLYEVNGSHCSCYGLEGQWSEELVTLPVLEQRLLKGTFGEDDYSGNNFKKELCEFLGVEYIQNVNRDRYYN